MASWPNRPDPFPRLYAILDVDAAAARSLQPLTVLEHWLTAGVGLLQLRAKHLASGPFLQLADRAVAAARDAGALIVINDRVDVAKMCGAHGVHLGQDDLPPDDARSILGPAAIIGLSTHNEGQLASAVTTPVDYVAIGPVFQTVTKDRPDPVVGLEGVTQATAITRPRGLPLVAIGGITLTTAKSVIDAGADAVAVISDLLVSDPGARARAYRHALDAR